MISIIAILLAVPTQTVPLAMLALDGGDGRLFSIAIVDRGSSDSSNERTINIACSSGCAAEETLSQPFDDEPLGIFRLSDQNNIVYVTAAGGSSYKIKAYYLGKSKITEVLDTYSLGAPSIITSDGKEQVFVRHYVSENSKKIVMESLVWNGAKFIAK